MPNAATSRSRRSRRLARASRLGLGEGWALASRSALASALAVLLLACGGGGGSGAGSSAASGSAVAATESEFKIELDKSSVAAGSVTFHVKNSGAIAHEFVVLRTDLPADQLPLAAGGATANEDASGITRVGEVKDIAAAASRDLVVDLAPGKYVVICNIAAHYPSGMRANLTVGG
jgi:uncharacterized cupredoxin-like copper-binding protein